MKSNNLNTYKPIFIGGCQRSGTTLLGAMLGSHPERITTPETQFKLDIIKLLRDNEIDDTATFWKYFDFIEQHFRFQIWGVAALKEDLRVRMNQNKLISYRGLIHWFVEKYGEQKLNKTAANTWVDHSPFNIQNAELILPYYEDATFIHIIRDGRAVLNSYFNLDWAANTASHGAKIWQAEIIKNLRGEKFIPKDKLYHVRFEDLVSKPKATLQRLCDKVGIEYIDEMIAAKDFIAPTYTVKQHAAIGGELKSQKNETWKQSLSKREIEIFEYGAGDTLEKLGYVLVQSNPRPPNMWENYWADRREKKQVIKKRKENKSRKIFGLEEGKKEREEYLEFLKKCNI